MDNIRIIAELREVDGDVHQAAYELNDYDMGEYMIVDIPNRDGPFLAIEVEE